MYFWTHIFRQTWLDKYLKSPISEDPLNSNMVTRPKTPLKSEPHQLNHIYCSMLLQFSWKKSVLVICKILGLFVVPLTDDDNYSLRNRDNLLQYFEMQLSEKGKMVSDFFFSPFCNFNWIFKIFKKNMTLLADVFFNLRTPKNVLR